MKKFLLPLLLLPLFIIAQSKINGKVVDEFQQPIPFANVLLYESNGESTEDRSISIDTGEFTLLSPLTGEFYILVTSMGFEEYKSQPFTLSDNTTINLSTLVIKEASFALQDVKVVGKKFHINVKLTERLYHWRKKLPQQVLLYSIFWKERLAWW